MSNAIACDVYGTLIDTQAGSSRLTDLIGDKAPITSGNFASIATDIRAACNANVHRDSNI